MSKDRDIDDILESLNQLLREGESHNDDHVEPAELPEKGAAVEHQDDFADAEEIDALLSEGADGAESADSAAVAADESSEHQPDIEAEAEAVEQWRQDEPDGDTFDEDDAEEESLSDSEPLNLHRVVLTEDMLVDNPQRSLLSLVGNRTDDGGESEPESVAPQSEAAIDHALMADLLERVTDDVIRQLPILIKTSLERHLNSLTQGDQGDSTDQTEE